MVEKEKSNIISSEAVRQTYIDTDRCLKRDRFIYWADGRVTQIVFGYGRGGKQNILTETDLTPDQLEDYDINWIEGTVERAKLSS